MFQRTTTNFATFAVAALAALSMQVAGALATDASQWNGDARSGIRLVSGSDAAGDGALQAGLEVRLAPGWKTYWRYPGDSGVPPHFDFGKSENVKEVRVSWPAPQRFAYPDGVIIGYQNGVMFPLRVEPLDASKPVVLRLNLDYAICEKLCVPAQAKAELPLKAGAPANPALDAARKSVPQPRALAASDPFAIRAVHRDDSGKSPRIIVDVAAPKATPLDLFVEGPTADWALPVPEKIDATPDGLQRFAFALDGLPRGSDGKGATLILTAVAGPEAIETRFRLD